MMAAPTTDQRAALMSVLRLTSPGISNTDLDRHATTIILSEMIHSLDPTVGRRGTKPALKSLSDIHKKALALFKAIDGMGADESFALRRMRAPSQTDLLKAVAEVNSHIVGAYNKIKGEPIIQTRDKPKKLAAARISRKAARVFQQITGKKPTWNSNWPDSKSPFAKFLEDIFGALDVDASVAVWAKKVCREQTKK